MDILSATLLLLTIMDPLGNVAIFTSALRSVPPERRIRVIARELIIALIILLVFLFCGPWLLSLLHLKEETLSISGGIVLFLIALKMIFPSGREGDELMIEPFIVPLATPMIAGPSVLATLLVMVSSQPELIFRWLIALLCAWTITAAVLLLSPMLARILKQKGSMAIERLMGMLLVMVAVQMFLNGLKRYLQS
ncbi:MAG TPA: MarC family protein [Chthoniobacter sp.]|nr:MarC family protein [Chthoniobacter sp.]